MKCLQKGNEGNCVDQPRQDAAAEVQPPGCIEFQYQVCTLTAENFQEKVEGFYTQPTGAGCRRFYD